MLSRRTCQCSEGFFLISWNNPLVAFKTFGPAFLEQHDPNLPAMRLCEAWTGAIWAGKAIISLHVPPLSVQKEFEHEVVGRVLTEKKLFWNDFRVNWNKGCNATQKVTIAEFPLDDVFGLNFSGETDPTFFPQNYRLSHLEQLVVGAIEEFSGLFVLAHWSVWVFLVRVHLFKFEKIFEFFEVRQFWDNRLAVPVVHAGLGKNWARLYDILTFACN